MYQKCAQNAEDALQFAVCFELIDVQNLWTSFLRQFLLIYSYILL